MTTATLPAATRPLCPECKKSPARHALERRNAEGELVGVRYQCSDMWCDHVWNDPPLPMAEAFMVPAGNGAKQQKRRQGFGAGFAMPKAAEPGITAPRSKQQRVSVAKPKAVAPTTERACAWEKCGKVFVPHRKDARYCDHRCRAAALRRRRHPGLQLPERTCFRCGKAYTPKKTDQLFCSHACKNKRGIVASLEPRACAHCGAEYQPKMPNQMYCTRKHLKAAETQREREAKQAARAALLAAAAPEAPPEPTTKACERCGAEYQPKTSNQRFCSDACRIWWGNHLSSRSRTVRAELAKEPRICVQCQQPYTPTRRDQKCCGRACTKAYFNNGGRPAGKADAEPAEPAPAPEAQPSTVPAESLTATLAELRARYAVRLEAAQAAVDACDVLLALERGEL
jgi:hypothetical protein